ncbi:hypothetical protein [Vibrio sp. HN007]|uniref:hypothetical protein n=1 Tax=Vibrio iocasae TaxID=3098914 RepID=UPI0035D3F8C4
MKTVYHFNHETKAFAGKSLLHKDTVYGDYIKPAFCTFTALPEFDEKTQFCEYQSEDDSWLAKSLPVEVTAYLKQDRTPKVFEDNSLVSSKYTLLEPATQYDEWDGEQWLTNLSNQYIAEYAQVDVTRESLYRTQTDPLENKARRLERNGATAEELQVYYDRINELVTKIKADNPWPSPPVV